ncbi:MAG: hypothetical protein IJE76_01095 [Bacteroidales bacterium]|nr:hypothetical protein [Bacteroidales bacterium]
MRRLILVFTILLSGISLLAQNNYNRLLLHNNDSETKGFVIDKIDSLTFSTLEGNFIANFNIGEEVETYDFDNIDSISFASVPGTVAANVNIINSTINSIVVDITRTTYCAGFKLTCMPTNSISSISDETLADYIDENISTVYYEDFDDVTIDISLSYNTTYSIVTVGFDEYGILCDLRRSQFTTPSENIVGNPNVAIEVVENNLYDFTIKFTPNSDVSRYDVMVGAAGSIESQYGMFSSYYGWANLSEMITDWGLEFTGTETHQWTDKTPNTEYEVFVQPWDVDGTVAPYTVYKFKTVSNGGDGVAKVEIELGSYELMDWGFELLPSQFLTFTPNDHTSAYRFGVYLAENYNADVAGYQEDLCSDPFMPTEGWFQYEALTTDFQIDPNTSCVAIAAAKNINDEWGPVTELFFTTPNEMPEFLPSGNITGRFEVKVDKSEPKPIIIEYKIANR